MISLPIDAALPALRQALQTRDEAVLEAPRGRARPPVCRWRCCTSHGWPGRPFSCWNPGAWPPAPRPSGWPVSWVSRLGKPWATASAWTARWAPAPVSKWSPKVFLPVACKPTRHWKGWACWFSTNTTFCHNPRKRIFLVKPRFEPCCPFFALLLIEHLSGVSGDAVKLSPTLQLFHSRPTLGEGL